MFQCVAFRASDHKRSGIPPEQRVLIDERKCSMIRTLPEGLGPHARDDWQSSDSGRGDQTCGARIQYENENGALRIAFRS
jgi:hypothetical protein